MSKRKDYQIETTLHQGAVAIAGETVFTGKPFNPLQTIIQEEFAAISRWIVASGGIVGHLKSFLSAAEQQVMISSTGEQVTCRTSPSALFSQGKRSEGIQISIALIVFNIPQMDLEERLIDIFDRLNQEESEESQ
ncbi:MAG: hypothetical protein HY818_11850 [Acetobacterium woodii]|nr:hypothetical protein [Acetobacterium woodii]